MRGKNTPEISSVSLSSYHGNKRPSTFALNFFLNKRSLARKQQNTLAGRQCFLPFSRVWISWWNTTNDLLTYNVKPYFHIRLVDTKPEEQCISTESKLGNILNSLLSLKSYKRKKFASLDTLHVQEVTSLEGCSPPFAHQEGRQCRQGERIVNHPLTKISHAISWDCNTSHVKFSHV